jgi:DNA-binding MarR family transcriptional regulator
MARARTNPTDAAAVVDPAAEVADLVAAWRRERPDVDMESLWVFLPLRRALQAAEDRRGAILAKHRITPAMLDLLVALRRSGPPYVQTPSDLTRVLVLSAGGVSQRLDRLEQAGLVDRSVNTDDRRVIYVRLTKRGLATLDALITEYMAHEDALLHGLGTREREQLAKLLLKLERSVLTSDHPA